MTKLNPREQVTTKSVKSTAASKGKGLTDAEKAAFRQRVQELKASAGSRPRAVKAYGEGAVLAAIGAMPDPYRAMGERLHEIITANAPSLSPRTWYGMPAYAKDSAVVCFFRGGEKFKERYLTLGFNDEANLDEGGMWPIAFAVTELTGVEEARIGAIVKKAVS